jgi:hypothetical protein
MNRPHRLHGRNLESRASNSADEFPHPRRRQRQQTRAAVQSTIRFTLNELPEEPYPEPLWETKVDAVWAYIFSRTQQVQGNEGLRPAAPI